MRYLEKILRNKPFLLIVGLKLGGKEVFGQIYKKMKNNKLNFYPILVKIFDKEEKLVINEWGSNPVYCHKPQWLGSENCHHNGNKGYQGVISNIMGTAILCFILNKMHVLIKCLVVALDEDGIKIYVW